MTEPCSLRVLEVIRQWFSAAAEFQTVGLDLRDYTVDLTADEKPAIFVLRGAPRGEVLRETGGTVVEPLAIDLIGYAQVIATGEPSVTRVRERLLQAMLRRLYGPDADGATLRQRLREDYETHGNGAVDLRHVAPPMTDQGYEPPHAIVELPCVAPLHYRDREF